MIPQEMKKKKIHNNFFFLVCCLISITQICNNAAIHMTTAQMNEEAQKKKIEIQRFQSIWTKSWQSNVFVPGELICGGINFESMRDKQLQLHWPSQSRYLCFAR